MDRIEFVRNSAILGGATILPINNVFSQNVTENGIDKLVDTILEIINWDNVADRFMAAKKNAK